MNAIEPRREETSRGERRYDEVGARRELVGNDGASDLDPRGTFSGDRVRVLGNIGADRDGGAVSTTGDIVWLNGSSVQPEDALLSAPPIVYNATLAVLLMNNSPAPRNMSFAFNEVPGLQSMASTAFSLFDIWAQQPLVASQYGGYRALEVPPHGSVFLKLSNAA